MCVEKTTQQAETDSLTDGCFQVLCLSEIWDLEWWQLLTLYETFHEQVWFPVHRFTIDTKVYLNVCFHSESPGLCSVVRRGCVGYELPMKTLGTESLIAVTDI